MTKKLQRFIDSWTCSNYQILNESQASKYRNESSFQAAYANIKEAGLSPECLAIIEGRWSRNGAISVNDRYYPDNFWDEQLAKEQTQFLLRKGLMWMLFGHVNRGIEDKDAENGLVAGIVTHLQVIDQPTNINGRDYEPGDLFGRAIITSMDAGKNTYALLSLGSEISISSRGLGEYLIGETYKTEDGKNLPIMNPDTYELETFDFTRLPGISDAEVHMVRDNKNPQVKEAAEFPNDHIEDDDLDFEFESLEVPETALKAINESVDSLIFTINKKENDMAKLNSTQVQQVLEQANAKIASLTAKLEEAEQERDDAIAKADELEKKLDEKPAEPANETVEAGTEPEELKENPAPIKAEVTKEEKAPEEVDTTELAEFKAIADTPKELQDTLNAVQETLRKCEEDLDELEKAKADNEELKDELKEKENQIEECKKVLESYVKLGSVDALTQMVEANRKLKADARKQRLAQFTEHYSVKKGITQESVKRIIESTKSVKAAKAVLDSLPNVNPNKGLYKRQVETALKAQPQTTSDFRTFAESYIAKAEKSRMGRSYTV